MSITGSIRALACAVLLAGLAFTTQAAAQGLPIPGAWYRLWPSLDGPSWGVDVVNSGDSAFNNLLWLDRRQNTSGQLWQFRLEPYGGRQTYRITGLFRGSQMCWDVLNGGPNHGRLHLAPCGPYSGQYWYIEGFNGFVYQLKNLFTGPTQCVGYVESEPLYLTMANCDESTGQDWRFEPYQAQQ